MAIRRYKPVSCVICGKPVEGNGKSCSWKCADEAAALPHRFVVYFDAVQGGEYEVEIRTGRAGRDVEEIYVNGKATDFSRCGKIYPKIKEG